MEWRLTWTRMIWWAMIVGNLAGGFLLAYIISKGNVSTAGGGAGTGFMVGLIDEFEL